MCLMFHGSKTIFDTQGHKLSLRGPTPKGLLTKKIGGMTSEVFYQQIADDAFPGGSGIPSQSLAQLLADFASHSSPRDLHFMFYVSLAVLLPHLICLDVADFGCFFSL